MYARIVEGTLLFIGIPVLLIFTEDIFPLIPTILIIVGGVIIALRRTGWSYSDLWVVPPLRSWLNMLALWAVSAICWILIVQHWQPSNAFSFILERPDIWIMVIIFYPLLSAFPQEIFYRTFFWHRYGELLGNNQWVLIGTSGLLFMWAHILFMNWFALLATLAGGLVFAWRYHHTRSVLLVAVEHGLYGNLFFTIGLGQYLFSGAV